MEFKLDNLFKKRMLVAEDLRVRVSRHFYYTQTGVRSRYAAIDSMGTFVPSGTPGTGFFSKASDSHSYRHFVHGYKKMQKQNLWTLLAHKEPDFDKELARVDKALASETEQKKIEILSAYQNTLYIAKEVDLMERIVRGVKDKMGKKATKEYVGVISHYKTRIASLDHDARAAQLNVKNMLDEERLEQWGQVVDKFHLLVDARRLWSRCDGGSKTQDAYVQVFADMGIFDFIQSPFDTPILRDHNGVHYYFYPDFVLRVRSSVDFDVFEMKDLTVQGGVVELATLTGNLSFLQSNKSKKKSKHKHSDVITSLYGHSRANVLGHLLIPELNLEILCSHTGPVMDFVEALNRFNGR